MNPHLKIEMRAHAIDIDLTTPLVLQLIPQDLLGGIFMSIYRISVKIASATFLSLTAILTLSIVLLTSSAIAFAQAPMLKSGATVYIEPADGFEMFLVGAMIRYKIPLVVVADKDKGEYLIRSTTRDEQVPSWSTPYTYTSATFSVIDMRSSQVVFAGSTSKNKNHQAAAEECAGQLAKFMKKQKK